jgi:hypothetical protein
MNADNEPVACRIVFEKPWRVRAVEGHVGHGWLWPRGEMIRWTIATWPESDQVKK